jgi:hypothetical protein
VADRAEGLTGLRIPAPRWLGPLFLGMAMLLAGWTVWLAIRLPTRHVTPHWDVAWGGFDAMLTVALIATAVASIRGSPWLFSAAVATSTLLVVDAWFDVTTSNIHRELGHAVLAAALVELPLAAFCAFVAVRAQRQLRAGVLAEARARPQAPPTTG